MLLQAAMEQLETKFERAMNEQWAINDVLQQQNDRLLVENRNLHNDVNELRHMTTQRIQQGKSVLLKIHTLWLF